VLVERGREVLDAWPEHLRAHLDHCPSCLALATAIRAVASRRDAIYTEGLRHRTLAAVRVAASHPRFGLGWLLLPPAATCALAGTAAPLWLLSKLLQAVSVTPALAWTLAAIVVLASSLAAVGVVAMLVDRPLAAWSGATGRLRLLEV
jgi:hypothetical protein